MRRANMPRLKLCFLIFLITVGRVRCQSPGEGTDEASRAAISSTARLVGLEPEIKQLRDAQQNAPAGSPEQWKILALHQRILERVTVVELRIDATVAQIDNEIARCTEVHGYLADKRDRTVSRANLWSALVGGGLAGVSAGFGLSTRTTAAAAATGIAGGVLATGLAVYGISAQNGGTQTLMFDSNMLAELFNRPVLPNSRYPDVIWSFLGEVPPSTPDGITRRDRLMRTWLDFKRLDPPPNTLAGQIKIEHVTSMPQQHLPLTIDDLEDRIAMLQDVRANLSYLKRDLAELLASLPEVQVDDAREGGVH